MINLCRFCGKMWVDKNQPRNAKNFQGFRGGNACRVKAFIFLAPLNLISKEEADELNVALGGASDKAAGA